MYALLAIVLAATAFVAIVRVFKLDVTIDDMVVSSQRIDRVAFPVPSQETIQNPRRHAACPVPATDERPRSVILILGDGMGLGLVGTMSTLVAGPAGGLALEAAPEIGLVRTWTATDLVTDSAAAGSAMATGFKTANKTLSTLPDGSEPRTIFDAAKSLGMATGLVTTSGIADATPAAFLTHSPSGYAYAAILRQILQSDADVLVGGTFENHLKAGVQQDYLELLERAEEVAGGERHVVRSAEELAAAEAPVVALFAPRSGRRYAHGPPLEQSVGRALELLAANPVGFLLVIESEETDEGAHAKDVDRVMEGLRELDAAIVRSLEFASERDGTLVIVTADHDTGGMAIADGGLDEGIAELRWLTDDHLANWVPLFAFGPGAARFSGVLDNTEIALGIADLLGFEDFPSRQ